ncbi:MAG: DUF1559 domain-containing protein [Planctomycetaceae bacterium]|nr:DUF1559 domain-containing protein [Planctomycetaceae bacterium]
MKQWGKVRVGMALTILAVSAIAGWTTVQAFMVQQTEPESLLPAGTFLVSHLDGRKQHEEAYAQTAEYDAFHASGLADLFSRTIDFLIARDDSGTGEKVRQAVRDLFDNGLLLGSYISEEGPPIPSVVLVLPEGGSWGRDAMSLINNALRQQGAELERKRIEGRQVARIDIPNTPGLEFGMWQEGSHLVLVVGPNAVASTIACATGKTANITTNARWKEIRDAKLDFSQNNLTWLDWQRLQEVYGGIPLPTPQGQELTVAEILAFIGLDKLDHVTFRSGYKGRSLWSESTLAGLGQAGGQLTLENLPPLPSKFTAFTAARIDPQGFYQRILGMARDAAAFAGQEDQLEGMLAQLPGLLGFDPQEDLLQHLGNVLCIYDDANGGAFGMGTALCVSLKDADQVRDFLSAQMDRFEEAEENGDLPELPVYPVRVEKDGEELYVFDLAENDQTIQMGAIQVVGDWLVLAVMPQSIEAFRMRLDEELPRWTATSEYAEAFGELPREFTSLTIMNTRETYQMLLNWGMVALPFIQSAALQADLLRDGEDLPFYIEDFPPAERITSRLFPNVTITVADENGIRMISRASSHGIPLPGGNGGVGVAAVTGTLVALLLPAVQAARHAARQSQSKNNLKQIGLAMHNYHDTHNAFPRGTVANPRLKPNERLSWAYSILPFIEQAALYEQIQAGEAWDSADNSLPSSLRIPIFQDPAMPVDDFSEYGPIHYAGMAGVGKDAPELPKGHERAGVFGYNRETRMRDITDGTSNTIMITGVSEGIGPWAQGGTSTLRSLTKKPYINGPDGIGGPYSGGVLVLFCDGSVRLVSENIDPATLENLVKIADGNAIGEF